MADLGRVCERQGRYEEAREWIERALDQVRAISEEHPHLRTRLNALGRLTLKTNELRDSERYLREAERYCVDRWGDDHTRTAETRLYLITTLAETATEFDDLIAIARRNVAIEEAIDPEARAYTHQLFGLGVILLKAGRLAEADSTVRVAKERWIDDLGMDHPSIARCDVVLGKIAARLGDPKAAETFFREALDIYRRRLGEPHPVIASTEVHLANALMEQGRHAEVESRLAAALPILEKAYPPGHPEIAACHDALSRSSRLRG